MQPAGGWCRGCGGLGGEQQRAAPWLQRQQPWCPGAHPGSPLPQGLSSLLWHQPACIHYARHAPRELHCCHPPANQPTHPTLIHPSLPPTRNPILHPAHPMLIRPPQHCPALTTDARHCHRTSTQVGRPSSGPVRSASDGRVPSSQQQGQEQQRQEQQRQGAGSADNATGEGAGRKRSASASGHGQGRPRKLAKRKHRATTPMRSVRGPAGGAAGVLAPLHWLRVVR